jgi:CheY-like chemotaxis protein
VADLLIVDDNEGLRESMSTYFEGQGHRLETADGVGQAMERVRRHTPDVVLSDLVMEDGSGLNLREQIQGLGLKKDPYFILLTAHPTLDSASQAYRHGVDLYLTKPFQLPALALAVDNALRQMKAVPPAGPAAAGAAALAQADAFYHEFFLTLNPVLPRLLLLLEGRYGGLQPDQLACVSAIFDTWRRLAWSMQGFHERLAGPPPKRLETGRWSGPAALRRILDRLEPDLAVSQLTTQVQHVPKLPLALVHAASAEALLEACILRLAAFSGPGAVLSFAWAADERRLRLTLSSDQTHPDLTPQLMHAVALLPPILPLLEQAGVQAAVRDDSGPWELVFRLA